MKQLAVVVATILSKPEAVRVLGLLLPCWYQEINIRSYHYPLQQANETVREGEGGEEVEGEEVVVVVVMVVVVAVVVVENWGNIMDMMTHPPRSTFWTRQDYYHRDLDAPRQRL